MCTTHWNRPAVALAGVHPCAGDGSGDAALLDAALEALVARERAAELDASYAAYDEQPLNTPDEWGDLGTFREAAAAS